MSKIAPAALRVKSGTTTLMEHLKLYTLLYDSPPGQFEYPVTQPGLGGILEYLKQAYGNPPIYIHENGVEYLQAYIGNLLDAVRMDQT
ncbi:hypothetical protein HAX54_035762 [Datura stramonium]|uniref:4-hydroxy-7-methoxy-3-oxo-3,4-dihydro-2H-1,4-benzoxazin-2-yl glucosidebeta-D-glucosidase n=1 Tax=Datura stramonium TaxID=4076 RepID=A0ABS8VIV9_DATST|nr:hypothetical protein [Datura stramonium]